MKQEKERKKKFIRRHERSRNVKGEGGKGVRWRESRCSVLQPENQIISLEATKRRFQRERKPLETTLVSQMPDPNSRVFFARLRWTFSLSVYLSIYLSIYPSFPFYGFQSAWYSKSFTLLFRKFCSVNKETFSGPLL